MSHRFFLNSPPDKPVIWLDGDQAHHAIHVMRFKSGDEIVLFDGTGDEHFATIQSIEKRRIELQINQTKRRPRELSSSISLAVALPKGDRQKFLVEKLVELGVAQLIPLNTNRSVAVANTKVIQRLQKQVVEASKQSGRNTLMKITAPQTIGQLVASIEPNSIRLIANPYEGNPIASFTQPADSPPRDFLTLIGPEGGFDDSENQLATETGFQPVRLGPSILRVETAAIAIASILGIGTHFSTEN